MYCIIKKNIVSIVNIVYFYIFFFYYISILFYEILNIIFTLLKFFILMYRDILFY